MNIPTSVSPLLPKRVYTELTLKGELGFAVRSHRAPGSLVGSFSVIANRGWLPWLVEGLEVEPVKTPVEEGAVAMLVEVFSIVETTLSSIVVGTVGGGPAGLSVPD